jgi:YesN/AraC family two-component response regulator
MAKTIKLLIIDDEEVVILGVKKILKNDQLFDYMIDFAFSAEEGLNKSLQNTYNVIISDIVMPGMDGMELLQKLLDKNISAQIIMFTGYATMKTALLALKMGAFDFIAKPFTSDELYSSLHRALRTKSVNIEKRGNRLEEKNLIKPFNVYSIPGQAWAKVQEDFSVLIGIEKDFLNSISEIEKLELLSEGEQVIQGQGFGKIITKNNIVHTLPSPLSGRILSTNKHIIDNIPQIYDFPIFEGWLIHIEQTKIEKEVSNLILLK